MTSRQVDVAQLRVLALRLAGERALEGPERVHRREDHAERGDDRVRTIEDERSEQRQELADEPGEAGQADAGEQRDEEEPAEDRRDLPEAAERR